MLWKCPNCKYILEFEQKCKCGLVLASFDDVESLIVTEDALNNHRNEQISAKIGSHEPMNVEKDSHSANEDR